MLAKHRSGKAWVMPILLSSVADELDGAPLESLCLTCGFQNQAGNLLCQKCSDVLFALPLRCDLVMKGGITSGIVYPYRANGEHGFEHTEQPNPHPVDITNHLASRRRMVLLN